MTEAEWLTCTDPQKMLGLLQGQASDRKLRLFACACCRRIGDFLSIGAPLEAVEVAERYADGRATNQERLVARSAVIASAEAEGTNLFDDYEHELIEWGAVPGGWALMACLELLRGKGFEAVRVASDTASEVGGDARRWRADEEGARLSIEEDYSAEQNAQIRLLHDIFGNPFCPVSLKPAWLAWGPGSIPDLAQAIYEERAFDRLPILADALEEAGCTDASILDHCRGPGPHALGCWVVDLILGKK
jgi:hypothetical protein